MPKNDNMLAILWMLNSGTKITAKQISERLEINIRSVYRYMDALCVSGVPIISEPGHNGGYSLLNNFIRAPLFFDLEEKKSLLHAAVFAMESGYPFMESLNSATSKLKMLYWNNKWYTIAFCHLRNEIRNFRVDRIINIISTKNTFKRPEAFSAREFFTENLLSNIESKVGLCTLVIEGKSEALNDLSAHWFLGYHLIKRTECRTIFLMDEYSIHTYVPHILLQYGKAIKVLEPNSFKDTMVAILRDLMAHYLH